MLTDVCLSFPTISLMRNKEGWGMFQVNNFHPSTIAKSKISYDSVVNAIFQIAFYKIMFTEPLII